jgi:hypothetical protein
LLKRNTMKLSTVTFAIVSATLMFGAVGSAPAQTTDDVNWINKCVADNKDEGQTQPVLVSYCTCMNNQMSNEEKLSITAWEKSHKKEADACSSKAGWKG